jgi:putative acetyltransferase
MASITDDRISSMYIHPDFIRQGIAKKLFSYSEDELRKLGHTRMTLSSTITAFPFYLKMGMKFIEDRFHTFKNGEKVAIKYMEKDL